MNYTYNYPMPSITGDVIVYDVNSDCVLLIKRKHDPYKDCWAIVGGFFNPVDTEESKMDVSVEDAAKRELLEEVNIDISKLDPTSYTWRFVTLQDAPGRDPRGRVVTAVYGLTLGWGFGYCQLRSLNICAKDDAADLQWIPVRNVLDGTVPLAFDHRDSIEKFINLRYDRN